MKTFLKDVIDSGGFKNFFKMFFKKHKLYNLIKREIHILTTTTIKKHANT